MKKTTLVFLCALCFFAFKASAQTGKPKDSIPSFSISDSAGYTGKYKFEGLPFDYMEISVKDGKLLYSGGEYSGVLAPLKDKKDAFDAGGIALFTFLRDSGGKITDLQIDYQGQTHLGKKEGR